MGQKKDLCQIVCDVGSLGNFLKFVIPHYEVLSAPSAR